MDISKDIIHYLSKHESKEPLYKQIACSIREKISEHSLLPGTRLPAERELAERIGVSRTTIINTYRELEKLGVVESKAGSGTYVTGILQKGSENRSMPWSQLFLPTLPTIHNSILREIISEPAYTDVVSMDAGLPDPRLYPIEAVRDLLNDYLGRTSSRAFGYLPTEGYSPLRKLLAAYLLKKGIHVSAENIMIVSGAQQGIYLITKTLIEPNDYVIVQSPTYIGALQMLQSASARMISLPAGNSFPLAQFESYLIRYRPKLFYTVPTFNNPTGSTITENERKEIARLARQYQLVIVEDDPYSDLWFHSPPPKPLKAYDNYGGVVYIGTFSKSFCPGLRTGFIAGDQAVINRLAMEKQYVDLHSNNFAQILVMALLESDFLNSHIKDMRKEYSKRCSALVSALQAGFGDELSFVIPEGGFYIWCRSNGINSEILLHEAIRSGVSFLPGSAFYPYAEEKQELRLSFATSSDSELEAGVKRLRQAYEKSRNKQSFQTASSATRPFI